jgi:hypothetical protein
MTSPYISEDCIYDILKYLQDYHSTLFNCLLVNRFWCRTAIPLLYADPFIGTNKNIILTLIPCFSKREVLQLKSQLKLIGINDININDEYKPFFEYPKYLENYDYFKVNSTIFEWFKSLSYLSYINDHHKDKDKKDKILKYFCPTFHQSIQNHCINVKQFSIDVSLIKSNPNFNVPITNLTELNSLELNNLEYLDQEMGKEFLSNIATHCLNLKELKVPSVMWIGISLMNRTALTRLLCTIIKKQNNLEKFMTSKSFLFNNSVLLSLEFQKHSLVSIEFSNIDFSDISFKNFINLYNLNHLIFSDCKDDISTLDRYEILQFASFKLKELKFDVNAWNKNIELTIIKHLGGSLQFLSLNKTITIPIIENISIFCLNLITLEIFISFFDDVNLLIFHYFKYLEIRKLIINIFDPHGYDNMGEKVESLASNLPTNVKEISFKLNIYNNQLFKLFLENCHNYLEKISLKFYPNCNIIGSEFLKIILNYIEKSNNSLKTLNLVRTKRILDDEELKLLDEIKMKGILVVVDIINIIKYVP